MKKCIFAILISAMLFVASFPTSAYAIAAPVQPSVVDDAIPATEFAAADYFAPARTPGISVIGGETEITEQVVTANSVTVSHDSAVRRHVKPSALLDTELSCRLLDDALVFGAAMLLVAMMLASRIRAASERRKDEIFEKAVAEFCHKRPTI